MLTLKESSLIVDQMQSKKRKMSQQLIGWLYISYFALSQEKKKQILYFAGGQIDWRGKAERFMVWYIKKMWEEIQGMLSLFSRSSGQLRLQVKNDQSTLIAKNNVKQ